MSQADDPSKPPQNLPGLLNMLVFFCMPNAPSLVQKPGIKARLSFAPPTPKKRDIDAVSLEGLRSYITATPERHPNVNQRNRGNQ